MESFAPGILPCHEQTNLRVSILHCITLHMQYKDECETIYYTHIISVCMLVSFIQSVYRFQYNARKY